MSRKPRELTLIGLYHVVVRGNSQQIIFEDDTDRYRLLSTLLEKSEDFGIKIHAWCLMSNHIHVLLDDPATAMPQMMQGLLVSYSRYFNTKTGRTGHLFDGERRYLRLRGCFPKDVWCVSRFRVLGFTTLFRKCGK